MSGPPDRTTAAPSHLADVWFQVSGLDVTTGRGTTVTTVDGDDYLDLTGGIAVTTTGHCHPRVVRAIQEQAERFVHAQANVYRHDLLEPLAARLAGITPDGIDTFFFSNSGAEAVEAAVKLARWATGRPNLIVFEGSFHGRTAQTMAMTTSKAVYRAGHQPLPAGVFVAPFPDPRHAATEPAAEVARCLDGLEQLLATQTAPAETAAVVIEPVLGEGGYRPAPDEFLQGVRAICNRHDLLFVADEIQSGFGRTGAMFAIDHAGVAPDVLVMAKGMASGFPMSAVGARRELMDRWPQGSHGGTYGGNPLGCAAALATIDTIEEEGLVERARSHGQHLRDGLEKLAARFPVIADVRGRGLMLACELVDDGRPETERGHRWTEDHVEAQRPAIRAMLAGLGADPQELQRAENRTVLALINTLADETGRWILQDHPDAHNELALATWGSSGPETFIIDRTFTDAEGTHWIIDYKTGYREGADIPRFLEQEMERHGPQLQRYRELLESPHDGTTRTALYFPLLGAFREVG